MAHFFLLAEISLDVIESEDIQWLEENDDPKSLAIEKWEISYPLRDLCKKVTQYFLRYKCLRSSYGHILVTLSYYQFKIFFMI